MLHEGFQYAGQDSSEHVVVADEVEYLKIQSYAKEFLGRTFRSREVTSQCPDLVKDARCLVMRGKSIASLPAWLPKCRYLEYLAIPLHLAAELRSQVLPVPVKTIEITGEGSVSLRSDFCHEEVDRIVAWNAQVRFCFLNFKALRHLHVVTGRRGGILAKLREACVNLVSLTVSPFSSVQNLEMLPAGRLEYLRLVGGRAASIEGVERFEGLTDLHLHNLSGLVSIEPLTGIPTLRDLSVGYCKRIQDFGCLSRMNSLRKLFLYGCGESVGIWAESLRKMRLAELSLGV